MKGDLMKDIIETAIGVLIVSALIFGCVLAIMWSAARDQEIRENKYKHSTFISSDKAIYTLYARKEGMFWIWKHNGVTVYYERKLRLI